MPVRRALLRLAVASSAAAILGAAVVTVGATSPIGPDRATGLPRTVPAAASPPTTSPSPSTTVAPVRHVVGLGDSVPAGTACGCRPYVALVADALARTQHADVTESNLAVPGLTTQGLLTELDQSTVQRAVRGADLTIVTIGANDFDSRTVTDADCGPDAHLACYRPTLLRLGELLDRVVDRLQALGARPGAGIVLTGYWNVFRDGRVGQQRGDGYARNSDALTQAVNQVVASVARRQHVTYVDVYAPFKGDGDRDDTALLAADGDHPNAVGHRVLATAIASAVQVPAGAGLADPAPR